MQDHISETEAVQDILDGYGGEVQYSKDRRVMGSVAALLSRNIKTLAQAHNSINWIAGAYVEGMASREDVSLVNRGTREALNNQDFNKLSILISKNPTTVKAFRDMQEELAVSNLSKEEAEERAKKRLYPRTNAGMPKIFIPMDPTWDMK